MDRIDNSLDDDIDAIWIGGADVVAELGVATSSVQSSQCEHSHGGEKVYRQVGNLDGKEAALIRQDERLCRTMSKTAMVSVAPSSTWRGGAAEGTANIKESEVMMSS